MRSTVARGYGAEHRRLRAAWRSRVEAGLVDCRRCGLPIPAGGPWDLGHHDTDRSLPAAPEHRRCNRQAAAIMKQLGWRRETPEIRAEAWATEERAYWAERERERLAAMPRPRPRIY